MIRRVLRFVETSRTALTSGFFEGGAREFMREMSKSFPRLFASFVYYWETERIAAVFVLYSLGYSTVLAWMSLNVARFSLILKAVGIYAVSAVVFLFWLSRQLEEGDIDFGALREEGRDEINIKNK